MEQKKPFMLIKDAEGPGAFPSSAGELSLKKERKHFTKGLSLVVLLTFKSSF